MSLGLPTQTPSPAFTLQDEVDARASVGITKSSDMKALQERADAEAERVVEQSRVSSMTLNDSIAEAHEALVGIVADVLGNTPRKSLRDILSYGNRMRGLGVLCIAMALMGIIVDFIMHSGA